jgi:hypothetical protein
MYTVLISDLFGSDDGDHRSRFGVWRCQACESLLLTNCALHSMASDMSDCKC